MNYDERHELNEQSRIPEEAIQCYTCGIELTPCELEEPMAIKAPVSGTNFHVEHEVCDKCKSEHQALNWDAYREASFKIHPFRTVKTL